MDALRSIEDIGNKINELNKLKSNNKSNKTHLELINELQNH